MSRLPILLDEATLAGLVALAKHEYRDPPQQAVVIIRQKLSQLGFLEGERVTKPTKKTRQRATNVGK